MVYNFSVIPIRWLLTVDSEVAFFYLFLSFAESVLVFVLFFLTHAVQEKFIAKLVISKVNFTRKTDIVLIAS